MKNNEWLEILGPIFCILLFWGLWITGIVIVPVLIIVGIIKLIGLF